MEAEVIEAEQKKTRAWLERLLRPRSIAIVGASATPGSLGESVLMNLEEAGYGGELYLINPKRPTIHGRESLGGIEEMPKGVDCAVLAVPGAAVLSSLQACGEGGSEVRLCSRLGLRRRGKMDGRFRASWRGLRGNTRWCWRGRIAWGW